MNILLIVNESPWGSTLANTALRFLRAALERDFGVTAVFFQGDGVYNAQSGPDTDPGALDLRGEWTGLARRHGFDLLLCSGALARRLPAGSAQALQAPFRESGLTEMLTLASTSDRVVSF